MGIYFEEWEMKLALFAKFIDNYLFLEVRLINYNKLINVAHFWKLGLINEFGKKGKFHFISTNNNNVMSESKEAEVVARVKFIHVQLLVS